MKQEFVICDTRAEAKALCPWAAAIAKVLAGFVCFESHEAYLDWRARLR